MALDDKDKKYIKDTVEDSVKSGMEKQQKKTETAMKRETLSRTLEERKQREKYIEELKKVQDDGQATMAQKFELFREEMKQTIPEDFKDTWKDMTDTMGKGAGKVGSGVNKLVDRTVGNLMRSNPLTAMLWNNKDIAGDLIGGTLQMGWGAVKGIGGAAAGLLNNATNNIISKVKEAKENKEEDEDKREEKDQKPKDVPVITTQAEEDVAELEMPSMFSDGESNAEQIAKLSDEMEKKINEVHAVVTKEQKGQAKAMTSGFAGMQKTMDAIKVVTDAMKAKQVLIATGVLLGAVALIGLVAWFKSGAFQKMIKAALGQDDDGSGKQAGMDYLTTQSSANMTNDQVINNLINANNNQDVGIQGSDIHRFGVRHGDEFRKYAKSLGVSHNVLNKVSATAHGHTITQSRNTQTTVLTFPFKTKIIDVIPDYDNEQYIALCIERYELDKQFKKANGEARYIPTGAQVIYTKVLQQLFPMDTLIPENTPVAVLDAGYQIIGRIEDFMKDDASGTTFQNYGEKRNSQMGNYAANYKKTRSETVRASQKAQAIKKANQIQNDVATQGKGWISGFKEHISDFIGGNDIKESDFTGENNDDKNPPKTQNPEDATYGEAPDGGKGKKEGTKTSVPTQTSENEKKTQQQNTQLKQQTQSPRKASAEPTEKIAYGTNPNINITGGDINLPDTYSDTLTMIQLDKAIPNGYELS